MASQSDESVGGEQRKRRSSLIHSQYFVQEQHITKDISRSYVGHMAQLDIDRNPRYVRQTGIIATLGPATESVQMIQKLIEAGMNIARIHLGLGDAQFNAKLIANVRQAAANYEEPQPQIAIMTDIAQPVIRTGFIKGDTQDRSKTAEVRLAKGAKVRVTTDPAIREACTADEIWIESAFCENIIKIIDVGTKVALDEGLIMLIVLEKGENYLLCEVESGGALGSNKRVLLPRSALYKPSMIDKARTDLKFAVQQKADIISLSWIDSSDDLRRMRAILDAELKASQAVDEKPKLIARIESISALRNIDYILEHADGLSIARGELGIDIPLEKIFIAQKMLIARCNRAKKPVIVGAQVLESMRFKPRATRAEMTDVANAVLDGADCILLAETARGDYPVECVVVTHEICREAEEGMHHGERLHELKATLPPSIASDVTHCAAISAVEAAETRGAAAILVITTTGRSASLMGLYRPRCPVLTITRRPQTARQCHLFHGLHPVLYNQPPLNDWADDIDARLAYAQEYAITRGFLHKGDTIVIVTGHGVGSGQTNTVRLAIV